MLTILSKISPLIRLVTLALITLTLAVPGAHLLAVTSLTAISPLVTGAVLAGPAWLTYASVALTRPLRSPTHPPLRVLRTLKVGALAELS